MFESVTCAGIAGASGRGGGFLSMLSNPVNEIAKVFPEWYFVELNKNLQGNMETLVLTPPDDAEMTPEQAAAGSVFLAGTIEMGKGENWQPNAIKALSGKVGAIYNPRRADWDSDWQQSISEPKFAEQVNWELDHIARADMVYFYFDPKSKSPITLLELGLVGGVGSKVAGAAPAVVCCPPGFWRRGNIEIVCARHNIPLYADFDESIGAVLTILRLSANSEKV